MPGELQLPTSLLKEWGQNPNMAASWLFSHVVPSASANPSAYHIKYKYFSLIFLVYSLSAPLPTTNHQSTNSPCSYVKIFGQAERPLSAGIMLHSFSPPCVDSLNSLFLLLPVVLVSANPTLDGILVTDTHYIMYQFWFLNYIVLLWFILRIYIWSSLYLFLEQSA